MLYEIDRSPSFRLHLYNNSVARKWKTLIDSIYVGDGEDIDHMRTFFKFQTKKNVKNILITAIKNVNSFLKHEFITIPTKWDQETFNNLHIIHSFSGVVAFTDLSANTSTVIHGNNITTGIIQSASSNYGTDAEGHFATSGTHLDLDDGRLRSPKFYIDGSGLGFKDGAMGGTNSLGGTITVGNKVIIDGTNEKIEITDGTNVRVKIGKLS